jgi:hypothetical protein
MGCEGLNARQHKYHHPKPKEVLAEWDGKKPVYAFTRNPYTQILSWYYHAKRDNNPEGFMDFINTYKHGWLFGGKLNIYEDVPDMEVQYFLFEKGHEHFFEYVGLPNVEVPHVGATQPNYNLLTEQAMEAIATRFEFDMDHYINVKQNYAVPSQ